MKQYIFFLVLINGCFALNSNKCNVCECKPQDDIQTCICQPSSDETDCDRESHKLLISGHEILITKRFSLNIIQSIVIKNIDINELMVSFTNELLPKLYRLEFNKCNLTQIKKETFFNVQNITQLILKKNPQLSLETDSFNYVQNLMFLNLEKNNLNDLPVNIFGKLSKLEELHLDNNQLKNLSKEILQPLSKLQKIQIEKNGIHFVKRDLFESNNNLKVINLNGNEIEFLNSSLVENFNELNLYLQNNPLNCDCSLRDLYDVYHIKKEKFKIHGKCTNNHNFMALKRENFNCPAKLISISKTQNNNSFTLNCSIESDGKPNVKWLYENNSFADVRYNKSYLINKYDFILELKVDPQKYYENNLTCLLINNNFNSTDTMSLPIIYLPEFNDSKLNNSFKFHPPEQKEFEVKNVSDKIVLTHNIITRNDFNITWSIETLHPDKHIGLIFNLTNLKTNEYSADLIFDDFNDNFTGKCTLFVNDDSSEMNITKSFNIANDTNISMTEFLFLFQYKDNVFNFVEKNNGFCNFVNNNTQFVNSGLGQSYQYTCYFEPYKIGYFEISLFVCVFIVIIVIIFMLYCIKYCRKYKGSYKIYQVCRVLMINVYVLMINVYVLMS